MALAYDGGIFGLHPKGGGSIPSRATKQLIKKIMKIIKIDDITIQCVPFGGRYSCHIIEHDLNFSSKVDDEMIIKKARIMIEMKSRFLIEFPQYK